MSAKEDLKARNEKRIFAEFASAARLNIDAGSIRSEDKPDISCMVSGQRHRFELTEITDEDLARNVSINRKTFKTTGGPYSDDEPLIRAFSNKAAKAKYYSVLDGKLELLAYYDKQPPPFELQPSTKVDFYWLTQDMVFLGPWSRLWIYDARDNRVLWTCQRKSGAT